MSNMSLDEMHDEETRSIAASSHVSSSHLSVNRTKMTRDPGMRRAAFEVSRESSKESSNSESDDHIEQHQRAREIKSRISQTSMASDTSSRLSHVSDSASVMLSVPPARAATPPLSNSPTLRRMRMIKSLSQDAGSVASDGGVTSQMTSSVSDGALQNSILYKRKVNQPTLDEVPTYVNVRVNVRVLILQ